MKISISISVLILCLGAFFGWKEQTVFSSLKEERERLSLEASNLGLPVRNDFESGTEDTLSKRQRADKIAGARKAAFDIIALVRDIERLQDSGDSNDIAIQGRILEGLEMLKSMDSEQLQILINQFRKADGISEEIRMGLIQITVSNLAERNPGDALSLLVEDGNPLMNLPDHEILVLSSLSNLSEADPSSAESWLRENKLDFMDKDKIHSALVEGTARSNLSLAIKQIQEFEIQDRGAVLAQIAGDLSDPSKRKELLLLMKAQPDLFGKEEQGRALNAMGRQIGKSGYEESVRWIKENKLDELEITKLISGGLMSQAKGKEMGRWVEWMGETLPEDTRNRLISERVKDWTSKDHRAAGEWLLALPNGPAKSASVVAFATSVAPYDPKIAAEWVLTLPAGSKRNDALKAVYEKWPADDPERSSFLKNNPVE